MQSRYNDGVSFEIRRFRKADFDTLWEIDQACFDPQLSYSRPELAFYMKRAGAFTLVAESSERSNGEGSTKRGNGAPPHISASIEPGFAPPTLIWGFIVAETRRQVGHIITIDVMARARRLGVGSALLLAAEDQLRLGGAVSVALETPVNNDAAIRFYKQKEYFVEKTVRGYYSNQLDALVMTKQLKQPVATPSPNVP